jgi:hypothetical protein
MHEVGLMTVFVYVCVFCAQQFLYTVQTFSPFLSLREFFPVFPQFLFLLSITSHMTYLVTRHVIDFSISLSSLNFVLLSSQ